MKRNYLYLFQRIVQKDQTSIQQALFWIKQAFNREAPLNTIDMNVFTIAYQVWTWKVKFVVKMVLVTK